MFSRADANQLRESLESISFCSNTVPSDRETGDLVQNYRAHYGLDFSSLRSPKESPKESPTQSTIQHAIGTIESGQFTLVCHHFSISHASISNSDSSQAIEPESENPGTIFLLHGYLDHSGIYGHLIRHCLQLGYGVVIFDLPGHGLSSGETASIDSFFRYEEAFRDCMIAAQSQNLAKPWSVIAQSTGAAVLIDSLLNPHHVFIGAGSSNEASSVQDVGRLLHFKHMIIMAPLVRPIHWALNRISFAISKLFIKSLSRGFSTNSHDKEFLKFLRYEDALQSKRLPVDWIKAMAEYLHRFAQASRCEESLHIIQGTGDSTVDWKYNMSKLRSKFPNSIVYFVDKARHHLVNESEEFREEVFSHIGKILD